MIEERDELTGQGVGTADLGAQALDRRLIDGFRIGSAAQLTNLLECLRVIAIQRITRDADAAAKRRHGHLFSGACRVLGRGLFERGLNTCGDRAFSVRHGC